MQRSYAVEQCVPRARPSVQPHTTAVQCARTRVTESTRAHGKQRARASVAKLNLQWRAHDAGRALEHIVHGVQHRGLRPTNLEQVGACMWHKETPQSCTRMGE